MSKYYPINEESARRSKEMMSFYAYTPGVTTAGYKQCVDEVYALAKQVEEARGEERGARAYKLADRYAKHYAEYINKENEIGCRCPSVLIAGPANFPVRKKEKQNQAFNKNHNYYKYICSIKDKIQDLLYSKEIIKSGDADAIEQLQEKVARLSDDQECMKQVNAYYRKHKSLNGCPYIDEEIARKLISSMASYERAPYPAWALNNNRQNLKATQDRLDNLLKMKEMGSSETETDFCKVVENTESMRIQLFFDGKPEPEIRALVKKHGFRWAPSVGAWQRQLTNNGKYAVKRLLSELAAQ